MIHSTSKTRNIRKDPRETG